MSGPNYAGDRGVPGVPGTEPRFLIWSYERQAWWKPRSRGYTTDYTQAGSYPRAQAQSICWSANQFSKHQNEVMIRDWRTS